VLIEVVVVVIVEWAMAVVEVPLVYVDVEVVT
jgi:hypothetical protein